MAHFLAPQPPEKELPVFFNVDGPVGEQPAQNKREDVLLVQFAFQVMANSPLPGSEADMTAAARAVVPTGIIDAATITAIRTLQSKRKKAEPGLVVDGRVSPAKGYRYGTGIYTIVHLNNSMQNRNLRIWPRIDRIAGCPAELQLMVQRTVGGT